MGRAPNRVARNLKINGHRGIDLPRKYVFSMLAVLMSGGCVDALGSVILFPDTVVPNACVYDNTGVYSDEFEMTPIWEDTIYTCERGYFLPKLSEVCATCPENSYCPGGEYTYSETADTGLNACPDGLVAPDGMWELAQCGRKFHVGDGVLYLRTVKQTTPSLNFDIDGDGVADYFANLSTTDVTISKDSTRRMKVKYGDVLYFVHDDTVNASVGTE